MRRSEARARGRPQRRGCHLECFAPDKARLSRRELRHPDTPTGGGEDLLDVSYQHLRRTREVALATESQVHLLIASRAPCQPCATNAQPNSRHCGQLVTH